MCWLPPLSNYPSSKLFKSALTNLTLLFPYHNLNYKLQNTFSFLRILRKLLRKYSPVLAAWAGGAWAGGAWAGGAWVNCLGCSLANEGGCWGRGCWPCISLNCCCWGRLSPPPPLPPLSPLPLPPLYSVTVWGVSTAIQIDEIQSVLKTNHLNFLIIHMLRKKSNIKIIIYYFIDHFRVHYSNSIFKVSKTK